MQSLQADTVIILGASARAAAQSAIRAGITPWCIDLYADRDLRAIAPVKRCPADRYPYAMLDMLDDAPDAPVIFTGKMEDYPDFIDAVAQHRPLAGSTPQAMRLARDPITLDSIKALPDGDVRLIKPKRGFGIRHHVDGEPVDDEHYVQPWVPGRSIGAVFDGSELIGATEQLVNTFQYAGSIGPIEVDSRQLHDIGSALVERCGLTGVFGVDLIMQDEGELFPIEVNPRYTASVEVLEFAQAGHVFGKRIVYAREEMLVEDLFAQFDRDQVADVPAIGERIGAGHPVCTVFADADDIAVCDAKLRELSDRLYTAVAS